MEPTVIDVKNFFNHGLSRPIEMKEFSEFWKALSENEKNEYREAVKNWDKKSFFIN